MHGKLAGRMSLTLTVHENTVTMRWKGTIEPADGFGEILFLIELLLIKESNCELLIYLP
jgi:hypothetical protein